MNQQSRVALVTGAGSGIGKATALHLLAHGYSLVLAGRRLGPLTEAAAESGADAQRYLCHSVDVSDPSSVTALFDKIRETYGRLDLLFNNAGCAAPAIPMEDLSYEQWQTVVDANLTGSFLCAQQAIKIMKTQSPKGGRIINNGSISAHAPRPHSAPYTATKHAITGLTKSISLDGRAHDIACGQIDIGNADTDMTLPMLEGVLQPNGEMMPEPRMDVNQVADAVLHMANLPLETNVQFMTIMATKMPLVGRG
jgi:NAD(P)-dependent dehydrogenase (short-subunit alcohol dehydrogenase family)